MLCVDKVQKILLMFTKRSVIPAQAVLEHSGRSTSCLRGYLSGSLEHDSGWRTLDKSTWPEGSKDVLKQTDSKSVKAFRAGLSELNVQI